MKTLHAAAYRALLLFVVLFVLLLPFPFSLLPDTGSLLLPFTAAATEAFGKMLGLLPENYEAFLGSDSAGMYVLTLLTAVCSIIGAAVWTLVNRNPERELVWLRSFSAYYLALLLLIYGFDKVFKHQFYLPEPNTLYSPLGQLQPDLLFWSTAGTSWSYSFFTGLVEVLAALLLLFGRTRGLGGLLAVGVMLHVSLINFGFDVSVKLLSLFLLLLAVIVAWPAARQLGTLFFRQQAVQPHTAPALFPKLGGKWRLALKTLLIALFLCESLYAFVRYNGFNDDEVSRPLLHGAYEVTLQINENNELVLPLHGNGQSIRRIFVHRRGHLIFQMNNEQMIDHTLVYDTMLHQLHLQRAQHLHSVWNYEFHYDTLFLKNNSTPEEIRAKMVNWKELPLIKRETQWVSEE
ncbi:MAG: hypothetical protein MUC87_18960 [Bacteroidia bacterium]|jgi:hypothetical protein|nr:hypothetical protein [Bacteroidia bacterium]